VEQFIKMIKLERQFLQITDNLSPQIVFQITSASGFT